MCAGTFAHKHVRTDPIELGYHPCSEFSYPPTPESFCSREQKTREPRLLSSHLHLLPCSWILSLYLCLCVCLCASVHAHVCLSLGGCLQAQLCRVYHYNFMMTVSDTVPKGNPVHVTKPKYMYCFCVQPCKHVFMRFISICDCVSLERSLCTMCTVTNSWSVWERVGGILLQEHVSAIRVDHNYKHTWLHERKHPSDLHELRWAFVQFLYSYRRRCTFFHSLAVKCRNGPADTHIFASFPPKKLTRISLKIATAKVNTI